MAAPTDETFERAELAELIGRKRARAQIAWLNEHGIPYLPDADGFPLVLRRVMAARLGGDTVRAEPELGTVE